MFSMDVLEDEVLTRDHNRNDISAAVKASVKTQQRYPLGSSSRRCALVEERRRTMIEISRLSSCVGSSTSMIKTLLHDDELQDE
mmetsp:Transcript_34662/g.51471  ORF Transcript_34662/g.51471 Transcript_34662/m.51471 type:complete len:84 (+) Transcript_34662:141-392(+)